MVVSGNNNAELQTVSLKKPKVSCRLFVKTYLRPQDDRFTLIWGLSAVLAHRFPEKASMSERLTLSTLTSSSTGSSDREDVTPFRRPDPLSSATLASPLSNGQPINLSKHSANDNLLDDTRSQLIHGSSKPNKTHPDDGTGLALKPVPRHRTKRTYVRKNIRSSEYVLL
ncbi:unnamed protein product [Calicophoron daubneyi]|uniref:Uncharacterized protein n=1 Tax=Calicophoron daubneyi TaxID=300641 RepID=A0AAV2SYQ9_CALDB